MTTQLLVVDDDYANRKLPSLILLEIGFPIHECATGAEALELIEKFPITHILLDISLPNISGISICKVIKSNSKFAHIKIHAYTAHAMREQTQEILTAGFDSLLIKPIRKQDLISLFKKD